VLFPDCVTCDGTVLWYGTVTVPHNLIPYLNTTLSFGILTRLCIYVPKHPKTPKEFTRTLKLKIKQKPRDQKWSYSQGTYLSKTYINQYIGTIIYIQNRHRFSGRKVKTKQKTCHFIDLWAWLKYNIAEKLLYL
jgi:hypothetical protein